MSTLPPKFSRSASAVTSDVWAVTISALRALSIPDDGTRAAATEAIRPTSRKRCRTASGAVGPVRVQPNAAARFVERVSERSILVNWCDSTSCHYCDQLWTRRTARRAGYCALTGEAIVRGDIVYGPYSRVANPPLNLEAMILASSLQTAVN